ncbi:MAG: asparagine synthase-related protein [Fimbriimonadales bacterium]|nr:asparagine synthase-related protein [Fimbriimonadales bacterium]
MPGDARERGAWLVLSSEGSPPDRLGPADGWIALEGGRLHWRAGTARAAFSSTGAAWAFLSGEVLRPRWGRDASKLAEAFERDGPAALRDLDGFFFAVAAGVGGKAWWACDRINSRRFFHRVAPQGLLLSDRPEQLGDSVDPAGLGWALAGPAVYRGRTLWAGVRAVPAGAEGQLRAQGLSVDRQWLPSLPRLSSDRSVERLLPGLKIRMAEAIREAVRLCLDDRETLVALSGGWDATTIAAEAVAMGRRLRAFSYGVAPLGSDSDALTAQRQSAALGVEHEILESYAGPLHRWVACNADRMACQREPIVEADAWLQVAERFEGACVLLGDEWLGMRSEKVPATVEEALARLQVLELGGCGVLADLIGSRWRELCEAVADDRASLLADARARCADTVGLRELLFLEQRLRCFHMPMRRWFPGDALAVRNPFLTRGMLDLMQSVPLELRLGKRLFRETVAERHAALFRMPRALDQANELDLPAEFRRDAASIAEALASEPSALDEWVPPDALGALLEEVSSSGAPSGWGARLRGMVPRRLRIRYGTGRKTPQGTSAPPALLLVRLLAARRALAR